MTLAYRHLLLAMLALSILSAKLDAQQQRFAIGQSSPSDLTNHHPSPFPRLPPAPPLPTGLAIPEATLQGLIADLASDSETKRTRAEQRLLRGGPSAVEALQAAATNRPNVYHLLVPQLLEEFIRHNDNEAAEAATQSLTALTSAQQADLRTAAQDVLESCQSRLRARAAYDIQRLGGVVRFHTDFFDVDDRTGELTPMIREITIDENWQGGEEGLQLIRRVASPPLGIVLYLADRAPLSPDALDKLSVAMPNLRISPRADVYLGIRVSSDAADVSGVFISQVTPASPAAQSDLRPKDIITGIDGKPIQSFVQLVEALQKHQPNDVIDVTFLREEKERSTKVTLQEPSSED